MRQFLNLSRMKSYSSGKLFSMWFMKSLLPILTLSSNSFIQIFNPFNVEIHLCGTSQSTPTFYDEIHFLMSIGMRHYAGHSICCEAYLFTCLSNATLQLPLGNSKHFAFFTSPNATFPEKLVFEEETFERPHVLSKEISYTMCIEPRDNTSFQSHCILSIIMMRMNISC